MTSFEGATHEKRAQALPSRKMKVPKGMKGRSLSKIEEAFREIGLTPDAWGRMLPPDTRSPAHHLQHFVRTEGNSTPLDRMGD